MPDGTVSLLNGDGGTGKSGLMLQLSVAAAAGEKWIGRPVTEGRAMFIMCEDSEDELRRRLAYISDAGGPSFKELHGHLRAKSFLGKIDDPVFAVPDKHGRMVPTELWHALLEEIEKFRPRSLTLDTRSDLYGGHENDRGQARAFIALLRSAAVKYQLAIILIDHVSVRGLIASQEKQINSAAGSSGSTAWHNSVRSRLYFSRGSGSAKRDPDLRVLTVMKANYGRAGEEIRLRWCNGLWVPEGAIPGHGQQERAREAEHVFLDLIDRYTAQGRPVSSSPGRNYAPALFANEEHSGMLDKRSLTDAMNRLFARGAIRLAREGPPSRQRERIVRVGEAVVDDVANRAA